MTRFSKLNLDKDGKPVETDVREIPQAALMRCPHAILVPEHYREDGSCRCDDKTATEMKEWGYRWDGSAWR